MCSIAARRPFALPRGRRTAQLGPAGANDRPPEDLAPHRAGRSAPRERRLRSRPAPARGDRTRDRAEQAASWSARARHAGDSRQPGSGGDQGAGPERECAGARSVRCGLAQRRRHRHPRRCRRPRGRDRGRGGDGTGAGSGRRTSGAGSRSCTRPSRIPRCREWSSTGACTGTRIASPQTRSSGQSDRACARRCECCPRTGLRRSRSSTRETAFPGYAPRRTSRHGGTRGAQKRISMR